MLRQGPAFKSFPRSTTRKWRSRMMLRHYALTLTGHY